MADSAGNPIIAGNCVKCKTRPFTINVRYAEYCDECFMEQTHHKYRLSVAKTKTPTPETILVAYSGGPSSHLLLHFTQLARITDPQRKNLDTFKVVCISEEGGENIVKAAEKYGLLCEIVTLASALYGEDDADGVEKLEKLFASCPQKTTKVDLRRILTRVALVLIAIKFECSKVYVGDSCSRLAVDIMADTCTGRGISLPWKLAPLQRYLDLGGKVSVVRPLREVVDLEVNYLLELIKDRYPIPEMIGIVDSTIKPESIYDLTNSTTLLGILSDV